MKKLLTILFILLCAFSLTACKKAGTVTDDELMDAWVYEGVKYAEMYENLGKAELDLSGADGKLLDIINKGELVIATSPDYPPSEFVDMNTGEIMGSDIMLAKYIANSLGVNLKIEAMDFSAVLTSIETGKCDLAISGLGYKADRAEIFELSHGYQSSSAAAHHTILVKSEDVDKYNSLVDFKGKTIDAQANSLQQMYCEDQLPDTTLQLVSTLDMAILDLQSGKIDAIALDATSAKNYAETSNGMFVSLYNAKNIEFDLSAYADEAGNVVVAKKGETALIEAVNAVIDDVMVNNKYTEMYYAACDAAGVSPSEA